MPGINNQHFLLYTSKPVLGRPTLVTWHSSGETMEGGKNKYEWVEKVKKKKSLRPWNFVVHLMSQYKSFLNPLILNFLSFKWKNSAKDQSISQCKRNNKNLKNVFKTLGSYTNQKFQTEVWINDCVADAVQKMYFAADFDWEWCVLRGYMNCTLISWTPLTLQTVCHYKHMLCGQVLCKALKPYTHGSQVSILATYHYCNTKYLNLPFYILIFFSILTFTEPQHQPNLTLNKELRIHLLSETSKIMPFSTDACYYCNSWEAKIYRGFLWIF